MDARTYVEILRQTSEHLEHLAGQLTHRLREIEHHLREHQITAYPAAQHALGDLAACSANVVAAADVLHERIRAFIEKTAAGSGQDDCSA